MGGRLPILKERAAIVTRRPAGQSCSDAACCCRRRWRLASRAVIPRRNFGGIDALLTDVSYFVAQECLRGRRTVTTINIRVIVFQEGDAWLAQALEHDIGAQAPTLDALQHRLALTLEAELEESLRRTGKPFGGIAPAPEHFQKQWVTDGKSEQFQASGSIIPKASGSPPVRYEMRVAA
jgi:hypothetical protein